jgi:hypothetical protein
MYIHYQKRQEARQRDGAQDKRKEKAKGINDAGP